MKKYLYSKKDCQHPKWHKNGNGQYICPYCGKTTTFNVNKIYKTLRKVVDLINGENSEFTIDDYIIKNDTEVEIEHCPFIEVKPNKLTWKQFERQKKKLLKTLNNSIFVLFLDEVSSTEARLGIYEILQDI